MHEENKFSYRPLAASKDTDWHFALGLDDVAKAGSYAVRLFHRDLQSLGVATNECDKEHYTFAHLLVSESAATGKQQTVRTIGQTLFLTLCTTGEVKVLTRTCEVTPQGATWKEWTSATAGDLPTPQELNTIADSLDNKFVYKGSGDVDVVSGGYFERTANDVMLNLKKWGDTTGTKRVRHSISAATETQAGVMSATDKARLNNAEPVTRVQWTAVSNINTYTTTGIYLLTGERLNTADGLPITNSNPGHTIHARLLVLDSSISGTGDSQDKCITQVLTLSNRTGGDGDVYIRTGRASVKNQLAAGAGWELWGKLQQNIEVGQVTSLDTFTGNGIYSGVYTNGSTFFETFVMVVINNYAVAGATGQVRSISQFKYALNVDGTVSYKTRTGQGSSVIGWGSWVDLGAATTTDIQDGAITAPKLSSDVREKVEKVPSLEENAAKEKNALVNGDTIVGLAREVYSRQGKVDTTTFLKRTTAGGTSVGDGVATLKQIGGNIVKNLVDTSFVGSEMLGVVNGHIYYFSSYLYNGQLHFADTSTDVCGGWKHHGIVLKATSDSVTIAVEGDNALNALLIDLTEMFGTGNEPTKEECDRMFACMGALPQGLTVAQPTGLKSIGYNQWNPDNVLEYKSVSAGTVIGVNGSHIAVIECLPCKIGTGENNGYVIGYGEGDTWSDEGIEVYLTPLNPLEVDGELYLQKLDKEATYGTYVPQIKGYLLVVTPTTDKLCAHFHWSGDRAATDYEPYFESSVALPVIPEMSEWGLAGIQASGIQDSVNLEKNTYTKRIDCLDLGNISYQYYSPSETYPYGFFATSINNARFSKTNALMCEKYTHGSFAADKAIMANTANNYTFYIIDGSYTDAVSLKNALEGVKLYYEIIPQEYPIVTKAAPNYIGSDYGVEEFTGSKVPLAANILFYMRSLVSETRNFLDRLMTGLGTSDATVVADKIIAAVNQHGEVAEIEEVIE